MRIVVDPQPHTTGDFSDRVGLASKLKMPTILGISLFFLAKIPLQIPAPMIGCS